MAVSIDIFALFLLLLLVIIYCTWSIKVRITKQIKANQENFKRVYCRFCRQDFKLSSVALVEASKKTAICPACKRQQWRGSYKDLL